MPRERTVREPLPIISDAQHIDVSLIPEHFRMELLAIIHADIVEKRRAELRAALKEENANDHL